MAADLAVVTSIRHPRQAVAADAKAPTSRAFPVFTPASQAPQCQSLHQLEKVTCPHETLPRGERGVCAVKGGTRVAAKRYLGGGPLLREGRRP